LSVGQSIVFVKTKEGGKSLKHKMKGAGFTISLIHGGDMQPQKRDSVIDKFRENKTKVLIATDVLSRGIDILHVTLVVNYDMPEEGGQVNYESYLHRIGRTARFGNAGLAISLVQDQKTRGFIEDLKNHYGKEINEILETELKDIAKMLKEMR